MDAGLWPRDALVLDAHAHGVEAGGARAEGEDESGKQERAAGRDEVGEELGRGVGVPVRRWAKKGGLWEES